jgi:hypothetical protein
VAIRSGLSRRSVLLALLAAPAVVACAPSTPDEDSWRLHARRAVSDVASSVETARLALEQALDDRILEAYLQTVVVDAEESAGTSSQTIAGEQPPREERERYDVVTGRLDEATSLLAEVRIAVVDGRSAAYPRLVEELRTTAVHLDTLEKELLHPPRKPGSS